MGKKKKARKTEAELMQEKVSARFFKEGSKIKGSVGSQFVRDMKRDDRSQMGAVGAAKSAITSQVLEKKRRKGYKVNVAAASVAQAVDGLTRENAAGVMRTKRLSDSGMTATRRAANAMQGISAASSIGDKADSARLERRFKEAESYAKIGQSIAGAYMSGMGQSSPTAAGASASQLDAYNQGYDPDILDFGPYQGGGIGVA